MARGSCRAGEVTQTAVAVRVGRAVVGGRGTIRAGAGTHTPRLQAVAFSGSLVALLLAAGCERAGTPPSQPPGGEGRYRISVDLAPSIKALGQDDLMLSGPAETRIEGLGTLALPALDEALLLESVAVRTAIAEMLPRVDRQGAVNLLARTVREDVSPDVRYTALRSLADPTAKTDAETRATIEAALRDPDAKVRLAAVTACARLCISGTGAERLYVMVLDDPALNTAQLARQALIGLRERDPDGIGVLDQRFSRQVKAALAPAAPLPRRALVALLTLDRGGAELPEVEAALAAALAPNAVPPALRLVAAHALGGMATGPGIEALAVEIDDPAIGVYARDALRRRATAGISGAAEALAGHPGGLTRSPLKAPGLIF